MYYFETEFIVKGVKCTFVEDCEFDTPIYKVFVENTEIIASYDAITTTDAKHIASAYIKGVLYALSKTTGEFANRPYVKGVR